MKFKTLITAFLFLTFSVGCRKGLVDSYKGTHSETMFSRVLDRGGVIGGSSAGATIQGSFLARGDTQNNQVMMGDYVLVYDGSLWSREGSDMKILPAKDFLFYLLRSGDRYNLRLRKIID